MKWFLVGEITNEFNNSRSIVVHLCHTRYNCSVDWQQTSVSDSLWTTNPMDDVDSEDYDIDLDVSVPYNIYEGDEHWDLFDELKL